MTHSMILRIAPFAMIAVGLWHLPEMFKTMNHRLDDGRYAGCVEKARTSAERETCIDLYGMIAGSKFPIYSRETITLAARARPGYHFN